MPKGKQLDRCPTDVIYEVSGGFGERNRDGNRGRAQRWWAGPQVPSGKPEASPRPHCCGKALWTCLRPAFYLPWLLNHRKYWPAGDDIHDSWSFNHGGV